MLSFKLPRILRNATLALALTGSAGLAAAAPTPVSTYHVTIDTSAYSGLGYLDFAFLPGSSGATGASALLSNFSGAFGSPISSDGQVAGGLEQGISFGNGTAYNDLYHSILLGGSYSFDIAFSGAFLNTAGNIGSTFGIGLLNSTGYLGNPNGNVVQFELMPVFNGAPASVLGSTFGGVAVIAAVPEASEWMMLMAGLALLGYAARRRHGVAAGGVGALPLAA